MFDNDMSEYEVGDEVGVHRSGAVFSDKYIGRITRTTPTRIYVGNTGFHKKNGKRVGDASSRSWSSIDIIPVTKELREEIALKARAQQAYKVLKEYGWSDGRGAPLELLEKVANVLTEHYEEEGTD